MSSSTGPRFTQALSTEADWSRAVDEVCQQAHHELGVAADLAFVFVAHRFAADFPQLAAALHEKLGAKVLLGCTGEAIVGGSREVEEGPALSLWAAALPNVNVRPMHLEFQRTSEGGTIVGWPDDLPLEWPQNCALLLLGEPYSFPTDLLLARLNEDQPGMPICGGMASGGWGPGENLLLFNGQELNSGAVAVLLDGAIRIRSVVSQGCRPIGRPFVVTKAERNLILELSGRPAFEQLRKLFAELPTRDQALVQRGLHLGLVTNEYQEQFDAGDFLIRNVMGVDPQSNAIQIGEYLRAGQTVQFHVRDAESADEDLRALLSKVGHPPVDATAGLLFTCNGRGTRLFETENHDAEAVLAQLGAIPLAGFFAQGEIGPVAGTNFVHGFTASLALFEAVPPND